MLGMPKKVAFILKRPSEKDGRRTFQIQKRIPDSVSPGKFTYEKIRDSRLASLNKEYLASPERFDSFVQQAKALIKDLYKQERVANREGVPVFHAANAKVLERFWTHYLRTRRRAVDPATARHEYRRAIEAVGNLPLTTTSVEDLLVEINRKLSGNKQRRVIMRLRTVLRFLGRAESDAKRLVLDVESEVLVRYLAPDEYNRVRALVPDEDVRLLFDCLYHSGMRVGELFAARPEHLRGNTLHVLQQVDRGGLRRTTKNKKARKAFVFDEGVDALRAWFALDAGTKGDIRRTRLAEKFRSACRRVFPRDREKELTAHDLRHCYAIRLLRAGVSIDLIAKSIGDSVVVANKHYLGFSLHDDAVEAIATRVKQSS